MEPSLNNGKKIIKALTKFGAPIANLTQEDFKTPGLLYIFGIPPERIDILNRIAKLSFIDAYKNKKIITVDNLKIPIIGLEDLVKTKKIAGSPQDLVDIENIKNFLKIQKNIQDKLSRKIR